MEAPISPGRRTLLKAGALTLGTPVIRAVAQPAARTLDLWVISDSHVGTDKAASEAIQHGMVGFRPPPVRAESLATALRQSEEGGAFGGPPFNWDIALNLGDYLPRRCRSPRARESVCRRMRGTGCRYVGTQVRVGSPYHRGRRTSLRRRRPWRDLSRRSRSS